MRGYLLQYNGGEILAECHLKENIGNNEEKKRKNVSNDENQGGKY
jgi:hypothetical protein